ncbi:MAG TPA: di-heme oxidoredictase family protein [Bryobacteraceae bacterium]|nr:di-heme oxidoredictase family protein [Bryobacteraceae bacterium]
MSFKTEAGRSVFLALALSAVAGAQQTASTASTSSTVADPGPRGGAAGAGTPLPGLSADQLAMFLDGQSRFQEVEDVMPNGLGPRFNSNSCSSCHAQPAVGGSSPRNNPQVAFANSKNQLPPFIQANGPVREARFIQTSGGAPDGGVHDLFVIAGRSDAPVNCNVTQENFSNTANISLRIPTSAFGLGLVEAVPDATLVANLAANSGVKSAMGISGTLNRSANDGTVTRFGWKAQNKSLTIFSGEAYNVEMGITNLVFPNERDDTANCSPAASPQDIFNLGSLGTAEFDDVAAFAAFMRFLAPPAPALPATGSAAASVAVGAGVFVTVGCALCHTVNLATGPSAFGAPLSNQTIHPFSDFALHKMGPGLADQISQGLAAGDQFRTAPLWGLGQRLFLLHDGRTSDLLKAIEAHSSPANGQFAASEANAVISAFNSLSDSLKQSLLNFLRSL